MLRIMSKKKKKVNKSRYRVWLNQAHHDLEAARTSLSGHHHEWVCYQSTQSVEKALKAVVVHSGFQAPRTHKLGVLVGIANRANERFIEVKLDFRKVESYTFISRYPFIIPGKDQTPHIYITKDDAETCLGLAEDLLKQVDIFLNDEPAAQNPKIVMQDYYFKKEEVEARLENIVSLLKNSTVIDVHRVMLYGSFSRDTAAPKISTMDILIVGETELPFIERIRYVRELTQGGEPILEPIVYSEEELTYLIEDEREGYLEHAIGQGKIIYERDKTGQI